MTKYFCNNYKNMKLIYKEKFTMNPICLGAAGYAKPNYARIFAAYAFDPAPAFDGFRALVNPGTSTKTQTVAASTSRGISCAASGCRESGVDGRGPGVQGAF